MALAVVGAVESPRVLKIRDWLQLVPAVGYNGSTFQRIRSESTRTGTAVEVFLLLARVDSDDLGGSEKLEVIRVVADCVTDAQVVGGDHSWWIDADEENAEITVMGNQVRVHQAIANLLSNARQHTPAGTTVVTRASHLLCPPPQTKPALALKLSDSAFSS